MSLCILCVYSLIDSIFNNISDEELHHSLENSGHSHLSRIEIEKITKKMFNIWIWSSFVPEWENSEKLKAIYMWEIASRYKTNLSDLSNENSWADKVKFSFSKVVENSTNALKIESDIIEKYNWKKFTHEWIEFDIIINWRISNLLLKYSRKWEEVNIWENNDNFKNIISEYITTLSDWFDFISPVVYEDDFDSIDDINNQIVNWKINKNLFLYNHKRALSIEWLKVSSLWKEWLRIFIDIVDMWIMNLSDFRNLAWKVVNWEITENNIEKLLKAWNTATNKLQLLVKEIQKDYPEAKISIWWDEIFIFIPWKSKKEEKEIINNIGNTSASKVIAGIIKRPSIWLHSVVIFLK